MTSAAGAPSARAIFRTARGPVSPARAWEPESAQQPAFSKARSQPLNGRDQERQCLAGTGLCRGQYIFTVQRRRYRGRLDRRRGSEMQLCQLLLEPSRQRQIFELCQNDFFLSWSSVSRRKSALIRLPKTLENASGDWWRASREGTTEAALIGSALNETEAGKAGIGSNCRSMSLASGRSQKRLQTMYHSSQHLSCRRLSSNR